MSMIILDGQNNVGKSTMVDWAVAEFGIKSYHHAQPDEEAKFVRENLARWGRSKDIAIFDRFYFTYLAYPSTGNWGWGKNLPESVTPEFQQETEAELRNLLVEKNLLLIHAAIPIDILFAYELDLNPAVRDCKGDYETLGRAFSDVFRGWNPLDYDYTNPDSVAATRAAIRDFVQSHT